MKSTFLSAEERRVGEKNFSRLSFFNGLGFGFIADTTVFLLALQFGASNFHLGFLSSLMHFSGIILVFTPQLLKGKNLVTVYFWAWLFRGLVCLLNALTLVLENNLALAVVLTSYTLFCIFRIVAVSVHNPIIQMISTKATIGQVITRNSGRFNLGNIVGKTASFTIVSLPFFRGLYGLLTLQFLGVIFNSVASLFLKKVPCREEAEDPKGQGIFRVMKAHGGDRQKLLVLFLYWNFIASSVVVGFTIPLLKVVLGVEQNLIFLFTLTTSLAAVVSMYAYRPFVDRVPAKAALLGTFLLDALFCLTWTLVTPSIPLAAVFALGFVSVFLRGVNQTILGRMLISSIPASDKVTYNSMINFWAGLFALAAGYLAGWAADWGTGLAAGPGLGPFNAYLPVFAAAAGLSLLGLGLTLGLRDRRGSFRETADIFLSFQNLKTLVDLYHLDAAREPRKRETILVSLKYNATPYALHEIRRILKNPLSPETEEVLKSLFTNPRPKLLPDILELARDEGAYHRATALFALGAYPGPEVVACLADCLRDPASRIRSNAAKSLGRLGAAEHLPELLSRVDDPDNTTWDLMNYTIAILSLEPRGPLAGRFFELAGRSPNRSYKQSLFSLFARYRGTALNLDKVYQAENLSAGSGWSLFFDEARELEVFHRATADLKAAVARQDAPSLAHWAATVLGSPGSGGGDPLAESLLTLAADWSTGVAWDDTTALAFLYFTLGILLDQEEPSSGHPGP